MIRKIKCLHIITTLSMGGAEMMLYMILLGINRDKFDCLVLCLAGNAVVGEMIEKLGIPVYYLNLKLFYLNPLKLFTLIWRIKKFSPDIMQGWMYHGNLVAFF